jgi:hypothetical protein
VLHLDGNFKVELQYKAQQEGVLGKATKKGGELSFQKVHRLYADGDYIVA